VEVLCILTEGPSPPQWKRGLTHCSSLSRLRLSSPHGTSLDFLSVSPHVNDISLLPPSYALQLVRVFIIFVDFSPFARNSREGDALPCRHCFPYVGAASVPIFHFFQHPATVHLTSFMAEVVLPSRCHFFFSSLFFQPKFFFGLVFGAAPFSSSLLDVGLPDHLSPF